VLGEHTSPEGFERPCAFVKPASRHGYVHRIPIHEIGTRVHSCRLGYLPKDLLIGKGVSTVHEDHVISSRTVKTLVHCVIEAAVLLRQPADATIGFGREPFLRATNRSAVN